MVVRDGGEEVVEHVRVSNVMVEGVQKAKAAVAGGQSPPEPVPAICCVVRQGGVRVLQLRDHDQPGVDHQVGHHIHLRTQAHFSVPVRR